jgi:hypothetical protein
MLENATVIAKMQKYPIYDSGKSCQFYEQLRQHRQADDNFMDIAVNVVPNDGKEVFKLLHTFTQSNFNDLVKLFEPDSIKVANTLPIPVCKGT